MALRQKNGRWIWDFYPNGAKGGRIVRTLPKTIKSKDQADNHIEQLKKDITHFGIGRKNKTEKIIWLSQAKIEALFNAAFDKLRPMTTERNYHDIKSASKNILRFINERNIPYFAFISPTPNLIMEYISYREGVVSNKTINKELYAFKKLHEGFVSIGHADPLSFELSKLYLKEKHEQKYFSEKFFEILLEKHPKLFLGEDLAFIKTPSKIQRLIPDSLFATNDGNYIVLEIQKDGLDRNHTYKLLDYRDKLESRLSQDGKPASIRMMVVVIGDDCALERKTFLEKYNIELKLLPISEIEKKILMLL